MSNINFGNGTIVTAAQIGDNNKITNCENSGSWTDFEWERLKTYMKDVIDGLSKESVRYEIADTVKKSADQKDKVALENNLKKYVPTMVADTLSGLTVNGIIEVIKKILL